MEHLKKVTQLYSFVQLIERQLEAMGVIATQLVNTDNIVYVNFSLEDLQQMPNFVVGADFASEMPEGFSDPPPRFSFLMSGMVEPQFYRKPTPQRGGNLVMHIHKFRLTSKMALAIMQLLCTLLSEQREFYLSQIKELLPHEKVGH